MSIVGCILLKGSDRLQGSCAAEAPWSIVAPQCLRTSPTFSAACTGKMCGLIHAHLRVHCSHKFEIWAIGNEHIESHMASGCNRWFRPCPQGLEGEHSGSQPAVVCRSPPITPKAFQSLLDVFVQSARTDAPGFLVASPLLAGDFGNKLRYGSDLSPGELSIHLRSSPFPDS